jgi:hypothetical protein
MRLSRCIPIAVSVFLIVAGSLVSPTSGAARQTIPATGLLSPPSPSQGEHKIYLPFIATESWFTNVRDGDHMPQAFVLLGTYPLTLTDDLWIFVEPPNNRFYPQAPINQCRATRTPKINGRWEVRVGLGQPQNTGEPFRILLTTAVSATSELIIDTLNQWCEAGDYPGWDKLPEGARLIQQIAVTRTAELWGIPPAISHVQLPGTVRITDPISGTQVPKTYTIRGTYTPDTTADIWVLLFPTNGRWYPQSSDACAGIHTEASNGQWQVRASFGGPTGEHFDIVVVLANPEASALFDATQRAWCAAGDAPGFLAITLPQEIDQKDRIEVTLNDQDSSRNKLRFAHK